MTRRSFLGTASVGVVTACGVTACGGSVIQDVAESVVPVSRGVVRVVPEDGRVALRLSEHPTLRERRGHLAILLPGEDRPIYVVVLPEGGYAAVLGTCTHQGCSIRLEGWDFFCPCHGSTFTREGRAVLGPALDPLKRYPVEVGPPGVLTVRVG